MLIDGGVPVAVSESGTNRFIYNLLPVGRFYDKRYGEINVSDTLLKQMQDNFGKFPAYEVPVKLGHNDGALSPGKVIDVQAKSQGLEITMSVDKNTSDAIRSKQYRYMSAEFDENYQDKTTGKNVGAVLLGAALVNQPANPYMQPLVLADDINPKKKGSKKMDELEVLKQKLNDANEKLKAYEAKETKEQEALTEDMQKEIDAQKAQNDKLQKKLSELEANNTILLAEKLKAEKEKHETEVKNFADQWAAKGVPPALLEKIKPLLLNDVNNVIKLSDNEKEDVPLIKFFGELLELMPKVNMSQISSGSTHIELSDIEKAKEHAKTIAESLN